MAKQKVTIKKTTVRVSIPRAASNSHTKTNRCPACGRFISNK